MSLSNVWKKAQDMIKEKVGTTSYDTWFSTLQVKEQSPQTLVIETPDEFFKSWIVEHYQPFIDETIHSLHEGPIKIEYTVNTDLIEKTTQSRLSKFEQTFVEDKSPKAVLNARFTFENFVIGPSNRFACAAGLAVAEAPAKAYNPFFVYGQVGLGKTHLIQAITHKIRQLNPSAKICYITSERFTNELIEAIRHQSTPNFRKKYREIDVLLIDDIHFIAGKESTQEEFFHTFNALHDNRKQIIITSDRPPKEITNLEERLRSRFAWGLIADVQPPDFETRVAILRKKIEKEPIHVPDDVIYFIAEQVPTNIRELEGALIRVAAYSLLEDKVISLEMTKVVLKDMVKEATKIISMEMIQKSVANHYQISLAELRAKRRNKNIVFPRQMAMYLARQLTKMSLPEIGNSFGGKDHTTVLHACKKIEQEMLKSTDIKHTILELTLVIKNP
jgi:chromosomal replication initiator protein